MGMIDHIVCHMPLPGTIPPFVGTGYLFQTKDTPYPYDNTYTIGGDGTFSGPGVDGFTGTVEFSCWNVCASGPGVYTRHGEDAESARWQATIVDGKVTEIVQVEYTVEPALPPEPPPPTPTAEEIADWEAEMDAIAVGSRLWVMYGGAHERGWAVEVVARSGDEICVRSLEDCGLTMEGSLEVIRCRDLGNTLFQSQEHAIESRGARERWWTAAKKRFDDYAATWKAAREAAGKEGAHG